MLMRNSRQSWKWSLGCSRLRSMGGCCLIWTRIRRIRHWKGWRRIRSRLRVGRRRRLRWNVRWGIRASWLIPCLNFQLWASIWARWESLIMNYRTWANRIWKSKTLTPSISNKAMWNLTCQHSLKICPPSADMQIPQWSQRTTHSRANSTYPRSKHSSFPQSNCSSTRT